jgi:hypothetical protein
VYRTLLQDKRIAQASHNVVCYRFYDESRGVLCNDNDDDGEAGAGVRMAEMMHLMKADNVFVMVRDPVCARFLWSVGSAPFASLPLPRPSHSHVLLIAMSFSLPCPSHSHVLLIPISRLFPTP